MKHRLRPIAVLLPILLLAIACSGGGGGPSTPTSPGALSTAQVEFDSYGLVNEARLENGVDPQLALREAIARIAREHSEAMRDESFFGHHDSQGRRVGQRLADAGISYDVAAENLAQVTNSANPARWAHDQLMASDSHRPNILNSSMELIGVGAATDGTTYWITQVFVGQ